MEEADEFFSSSSEEATTWFVSAKDCSCCKGFIYGCKGELCSSLGVCSCSYDDAEEEEAEAPAYVILKTKGVVNAERRDSGPKPRREHHSSRAHGGGGADSSSSPNNNYYGTAGDGGGMEGQAYAAGGYPMMAAGAGGDGAMDPHTAAALGQMMSSMVLQQQLGGAPMMFADPQQQQQIMMMQAAAQAGIDPAAAVAAMSLYASHNSGGMMGGYAPQVDPAMALAMQQQQQQLYHHQQQQLQQQQQYAMAMQQQQQYGQQGQYGMMVGAPFSPPLPSAPSAPPYSLGPGAAPGSGSSSVSVRRLMTAVNAKEWRPAPRPAAPALPSGPALGYPAVPGAGATPLRPPSSVVGSDEGSTAAPITMTSREWLLPTSLTMDSPPRLETSVVSISRGPGAPSAGGLEDGASPSGSPPELAALMAQHPAAASAPHSAGPLLHTHAPGAGGSGSGGLNSDGSSSAGHILSADAVGFVPAGLKSVLSGSGAVAGVVGPVHLPSGPRTSSAPNGSAPPRAVGAVGAPAAPAGPAWGGKGLRGSGPAAAPGARPAALLNEDTWAPGAGGDRRSGPVGRRAGPGGAVTGGVAPSTSSSSSLLFPGSRGAGTTGGAAAAHRGAGQRAHPSGPNGGAPGVGAEGEPDDGWTTAHKPGRKVEDGRRGAGLPAQQPPTRGAASSSAPGPVAVVPAPAAVASAAPSAVAAATAVAAASAPKEDASAPPAPSAPPASAVGASVPSGTARLAAAALRALEATAPALSPAEQKLQEAEKALRGARKKLRDITDLEEKAAGGSELNPDQRKKVEGKPAVAAALTAAEAVVSGLKAH